MLDELKGYLDQNFPADHESHTMPEWGPIEEFHWARDFNRKLFDDGWLCPHWPEEYGGRGLTPLDQMLIREEFAYRRVPMCNANGLDMLSPILLKYGSDEQKDEHLVKIARMEEMWCQGYSEPDGGSDLTHLKTTAIRDGEEYVVNGSKIWTGHAMHAHWMILLCRTDPEQKGSKGLSLLMVDLRDAPGIQIYPIRSMTGEVTFCQEYFMDARVPAENLVGPEPRGVGGGRHPAGGHERSGVGGMARMRRVLDDLLAMVAERGGVPDATAVKLGQLVERVETGRTMAYNTAAYLSRGEGFPPHMPSVLKISGGRVGRGLGELATEAARPRSLRRPHGPGELLGGYLHSFASSIAGGSDEIQHDIIGTRYFGISS